MLWSILLSFALLVIGALACSYPAELEPRDPVIRLGASDRSEKFGNVSKPLLVGSVGSDVALRLYAVPRSRLLLAAAQEGRRAARCTVKLTTDEGPTTTIISFDLPGAESRWREVEAQLPAVNKGELILSCKDGSRGASRTRFAQPLLVPVEERGRAQPLIVLLSLDTLRADHVAGFGGSDDMTPNLARLGAEGLRMSAATSEGTWTVPSHWSLLHSRLWGFDTGDSTPSSSLQHLLRSDGFVTVAVTGGGWINQFSPGFDHFSDQWKMNASDLERVLPEATRWIDRLRNTPTFLFVHSYAVHEASPTFSTWIESHGSGRPYRPTPQDNASDKVFYSRLVRRADAALGPFFDKLRAVSRTRPVLVVIVSDHGEAFGEHGSFRHGRGDLDTVTLHDELTHIPVLVWSPALVPSGRTSSQPMMLSDVAPTLLSAAGIEPSKSMRGRNLWPLWSGSHKGGLESHGSVSHAEGAWAYRTSSTKLIARVIDDLAQPTRFELFDLEKDPGARHDVSGDRPRLLTVARAELEKVLAHYEVTAKDRARSGLRLPRGSCDPPVWSHCSKNSDELPDVASGFDDETRAQLRALGYLDDAKR